MVKQNVNNLWAIRWLEIAKEEVDKLNSSYGFKHNQLLSDLNIMEIFLDKASKIDLNKCHDLVDTLGFNNNIMDIIEKSIACNNCRCRGCNNDCDIEPCVTCNFKTHLIDCTNSSLIYKTESSTSWDVRISGHDFSVEYIVALDSLITCYAVLRENKSKKTYIAEYSIQRETLKPLNDLNITTRLKKILSPHMGR